MYKKACAYCGKEFETNNPRTKFCSGPHFATCCICGKPFEIEKKSQLSAILSGTPPTCSKKCRYVKRGQTTLERHGTMAPGNSKQGREKAKQSMIERYGAPTTLQSKELKNRVKQTTIEKYGVDNPMKNKEIQKKAEATQRKNNNGKLAFNTEESYEHRKEAIINKYGSLHNAGIEARQKAAKTLETEYGYDHPSRIPEFHQKQINTMIERYGKASAFSVPEFREKSKQTMLERYGVENASWSEELVNKAIETETAKNGKSRRVSKVNKAFAQLLDENGITYEMEKIVNKKWYDFYIPSRDLFIEIDPVYTHNYIGNKWNVPADKNYQLMKTNVAEKAGYSCMHVFDWDDWDKVVSIICNTSKVYARNCVVKPITKQEANDFFNKNHIQNSCRGQKACYGLFNDDTLVCAMSFGNPRYNKKYEWELLRFCNLSKVAVVGGASKLFKEFLDDYAPKSIISYCDKSKFSGKVYEALGMALIRETDPNVIWSYNGKKITQNLLNARGYDQLFGTNYGKGTSNEQLMLDHYWLPMCDCGQKVFEWKI